MPRVEHVRWEYSCARRTTDRQEPLDADAYERRFLDLTWDYHPAVAAILAHTRY